MRPGILVICLDGMEPTLLDRWSREGALPHISTLMQGSLRLGVTPPSPFGDGVFWPSFFAASEPSGHGRYFRLAFDPQSYAWRSFDDDGDFALPPIWKLASDAGRRVAVIDVPNAPLVGDLNGVQLVDWMVHDRADVVRSWPAGLASRIEDRYGVDPLGGNTEPKSDEDRSPEAIAGLVRRLCERIEAKRHACEDIIRDGPWDLFMVGFQEAHDIGHVGWHLHASDHPLHVPGGDDPLRAVYEELDRAVGALVAGMPEDVTVVVLGGLGMEANHGANYMLDNVLRGIERRRGAPAFSTLGVLRRLYRRLPAALTTRLAPLTAPAKYRAFEQDRRSRRFFAVPHNDNAGAVRINLIGREAEGKVHERDYDRTCDELASRLEGLVNAETGKPAVAHVVKVAKRYSGPCIDRMPDLLVEWSRSAPIRAVVSDGVEYAPRVKSMRTGDHSQRAVALVRAPGIARGRLDRDVSVVDLGFTVAAWLDAAVPGGDGRIEHALMTRG